jgi:ubiquinone/menaquinone biosynthesis C-methylase UbiE
MAVHRVAAKGFGRAALAYERARPGYPKTALDFVAREFDLGRGKLVVDVGAGTGKLTRSLLGYGAEVVAVEPVASMRRVFRRVLPRVRLLPGTAEKLPFPDRSVDLIVAGQAFHWFEARKALQEFARVLRPGGGIALLWNYRGTSAMWVVSVWKEVGKYPAKVPGYRKEHHSLTFRKSGRFTRLRHRVFRGLRVRQTPEQVLDRIASISWIAALPRDERQRILRRAEEVLRTHPGTRGRSQLRTPYETDVYWCRVRRRPLPKRGRASGRVSRASSSKRT